MNWIKEVGLELKQLEISTKKLRQFGLLVGGIFLLIGTWLFYKQSNVVVFTILLSIGSLLFLVGIIRPQILPGIYKIWMGLALVLGWFISRIILLLLFYLIITPLGFIARLFRKKFLDIKFPDDRKSYWIPKSENDKINYTKMY